MAIRSGNWGQAPKGWITLHADVCWEDHGGLWAKRDRYSSSKRAYYLLKFDNMRDHGIKDLPQYEAGTAWVDLNDTKPEDIASALRSCGWELTPDGKVLNTYDGAFVAEDARTADLVILDAMAGYGLDWDYVTSDKQARLLRAQAAKSC